MMMTVAKKTSRATRTAPVFTISSGNGPSGCSSRRFRMFS